MKSTILAFQVSARWKILAMKPGASFFSTTCSVMFIFSLSVGSFASLPTSMIMANPDAANKASTPISRPSCTFGTRPINIMMITVRNKSAAVERFSMAMRKMMGSDTNRIYLNARRSAPSMVCMALRICAVTSTIVPFAISEGWNWMPNKPIHRWAPLVDCPTISTAMSMTSEMTSAKGVTILKYLHLIFIVTIMNPTPKNSRMVW